MSFNKSSAKARDVKKTRVFMRAFLLLLVASLLVVTLNYTASNLLVKADAKSDLEAKNNALKQEAAKFQKEINAHEADLKDQEAYINSINNKISSVEKRIELLDNEIRSLEANIVKLGEDITLKEADMVVKEADVNERFDVLKKRLRNVSKNGSVSTLQMILDSESYLDYLVNSKAAERIAKKDNEAIEAIEAEIAKINKEKDELNVSKAQIASDKENAEKLRKEAGTEKSGLEVLYAKGNDAVNAAAKTLLSVQKKLKDNKKERDQLEKDIQNLINRSGGHSGSFGNGTMLWPVPTISKISSYYGPRWGTVHRGIDIANGRAYGENYVAAADGTVIKAQVANTWGGGYGYHIIIDHGKNSNGVKISTLYAHSSAVLVSVGQTVKAGQVIGRIGNTGDSQGAHLHFEVRENGVAVNPISKGYIKG